MKNDHLTEAADEGRTGVKERMRAEFFEWVDDCGCDTDGAWSAWQAAYRAGMKRSAAIALAMQPPGGRAWSPEQLACFEALEACADTIKREAASE
jgi:hypothetical protein